MENNEFGKTFWNDRWIDNETKWDVGYPSTPLREFIDTLTDQELRILIPGCGNAYEAEYLFRNGFRNVYIADLAQKPLDQFVARVPDFPKKHLLHADFFQLQAYGDWDLILEQTFFCAINPALRSSYVKKMSELLKKGGQLAGVLFNDPLLTMDGPPFRGDEKEYRELFEPYFNILKMEPAKNSIGPRMNRELFFQLEKK